MPEFGSREKSIFMTVGVVGGIFAANTGAGIDMLTFIVLTLAYGIDEKISTPSSVLIMGINSIVGFFLHGVIVQDIAMSFNYWLVAIPIVVVGAPLGAIFCAKVDRKYIVILLLALITVEFSTTVLLVPMNRPVLVVGLISVAVCIAWFWGMLRCRICGDRDLI